MAGPPRKLSAGRGGGQLHRPASLFIQSNSSLNTQDSLMSSSYGLSGEDKNMHWADQQSTTIHSHRFLCRYYRIYLRNIILLTYMETYYQHSYLYFISFNKAWFSSDILRCNDVTRVNRRSTWVMELEIFFSLLCLFISSMIICIKKTVDLGWICFWQKFIWTKMSIMIIPLIIIKANIFSFQAYKDYLFYDYLMSMFINCNMFGK